MTSHCMIVCPSCRTGRKGTVEDVCPRCGVEELNFGKRLTLPKKNNRWAWKRILNGEYAWNRRKSRAVSGDEIYLKPHKPGARRSIRGRGRSHIINLGK